MVVITWRDNQNRHKTLSLKVTYIEFNFDVSDCTMQVVTHTSKIKMMPYNSVQMINSTLSFDVLLPRGTLMSKTLHRSQIRCMLLSVTMTIKTTKLSIPFRSKLLAV